MLTLRSVAPSAVTSSSPIRMRPDVTVSSPAIRRSVVVLPQPDGPSKVTRLPAATMKLTSRTAVTGPYRFVTCASSMRAARRVAHAEGPAGSGASAGA